MFFLELSRVSGAARSSRGIRSGIAEFHVYSLSRAIPSATSHTRRIDYANLLVHRPHTARDAQLRNSRLANFTISRFRAHRSHCVVHLVRKKKYLADTKNREKVYKIKKKYLKSFETFKKACLEKKNGTLNNIKQTLI